MQHEILFVDTAMLLLTFQQCGNVDSVQLEKVKCLENTCNDPGHDRKYKSLTNSNSMPIIFLHLSIND